MAKENKEFKKGRPKGIPNPDGLEYIRRQVQNLYEALLRKALSGDASAIRLCFELVGEYPKKPR